MACQKVCSAVDVSADQPKCKDLCGGPESFDKVDETNGVGICIGAEPKKECDLFAQDCGGTDGCYPVQGGWACIGAGSTKIGATCEFTNDCVKGALCVNGICQEVCSTAEGAPALIACSEKCEAHNTLVPEAWGLGICTDAVPEVPCDFWAQDCKEVGTACYWVGTNSTCLKTSKEGKEGDACASINECGAAFMCVSGTCREMCNVLDGEAKFCGEFCPSQNYDQVFKDVPAGVCTE